MAEPSSLLEARVRKVVAGHAGPLDRKGGAIEAETRLHQDLLLDWIHLHDILQDLEDELHVPIPDCELVDHLVTFSDLMALVEMAVAAAGETRRVA